MDGPNFILFILFISRSGGGKGVQRGDASQHMGDTIPLSKSFYSVPFLKYPF